MFTIRTHEPGIYTAAQLGCEPLMRSSFPERHTKSQGEALTEHEFLADLTIYTSIIGMR